MAVYTEQAYLESEVLQADPLRLVQMLYRGALQAAGRARLHLRERDIRARSRQITKASEILNELSLSIDRERGGEIAQNLIELYDYMQRLLLEANFRQVEEPLVELERLLTTLLEAWDHCDGAAATQPAAAASSPAPAPVPAAAADEGFLYGPRRLAC